jgi:hypothetical protein
VIEIVKGTETSPEGWFRLSYQVDPYPCCTTGDKRYDLCQACAEKLKTPKGDIGDRLLELIFENEQKLHANQTISLIKKDEPSETS